MMLSLTQTLHPLRLLILLPQHHMLHLLHHLLLSKSQDQLPSRVLEALPLVLRARLPPPLHNFHLLCLQFRLHRSGEVPDNEEHLENGGECTGSRLRSSKAPRMKRNNSKMHKMSNWTELSTLVNIAISPVHL